MLAFLKRWNIRRLQKKIHKLERKIAQVRADKAESEYEYRKMLLATIGALIVMWAYVEHAIDAWVTVVHETGGAKEIQPILPPSLDRELDYLKEAWKTTKVAQSLKDEGQRLMAEIHSLKSFRHNLVHGLADINKPELFIHLWKVKGADRIEIKTPYPTDKILENTIRIIALKRDLDRFMIDFTEATIEIIKRAR